MGRPASKPSARVMLLPSRTAEVELADGGEDDVIDEGAGLLGTSTCRRSSSRRRHAPSTSSIISHRVWLVFGAVCATVGAMLAVRTLVNPISDKPALDATAVQKLEESLHKQRQQLLELQAHLAKQAVSEGTSPLAVGSCADQWAVQYPFELDKWDGHSCSWKNKWGQCADFTMQCARTCGACTPSSGANADHGQLESPSAVATPATTVRRRPAATLPEIAVETTSDDGDDEDPDEMVPPQANADRRAPASEEPTHPLPVVSASRRGGTPMTDGLVGVANAAEIMPAAATNDDDVSHRAASLPDFVGGARSQEDVLSRLRRGRRRPSEAAATPASPTVGYLYGDGGAEAKPQGSSNGASPGALGIDDSYEGPAQRGSPAHTTIGESHPPENETPEAARARYVAGDSESTISIGSECGIPIREPAVSAEFAMAAFQSKGSTGPKGRRYSTVTYLSNTLALHPGEVSHLVQSVKLPRPEGAVGVAHYAVQLMQQTASEVRPARADTVYIKRLTLEPSSAPLGTRAHASCTTQPPILASAGRQLTEVRLPHPHGIMPTESDVWMAEVHLVRTEGLAGSAESAEQCACMREDIGSVHCCPHSCRFPSATRGAPAVSYRVSVSLTWLLADDGADAPSASRAMRPVVAVWIPLGGDGASFSSPRRAPMSCSQGGGGAVETELDVAACATKECAKRYGPWVQLDRDAAGVAALAVGGPRVRSVALVRAKSEDEQREVCKARATDKDFDMCSLRSMGSGGGIVQVRAELEIAAKPARGLDAGWVVYVSKRAGQRHRIGGGGSVIRR